MTLPDPHRRPPRAACQTIRRPPRGGDHQGVNQPSRRPLRGLRSREIENPGMGDRIQRNTHLWSGVHSGTLRELPSAEPTDRGIRGPWADQRPDGRCASHPENGAKRPVRSRGRAVDASASGGGRDDRALAPCHRPWLALRVSDRRRQAMNTTIARPPATHGNAKRGSCQRAATPPLDLRSEPRCWSGRRVNPRRFC
jgi:hypothetical protein